MKEKIFYKTTHNNIDMSLCQVESVFQDYHQEYIAIKFNDIEVSICQNNSEFWPITHRCLNEIWDKLCANIDSFCHYPFDENPFRENSEYNIVLNMCNDIIAKYYNDEKGNFEK